MKVLFIGGTGNISSASSQLAVKNNIELVHLNRGQSKDYRFQEIETLVCDINNPEEAHNILRNKKYDAVVNWICFTPDQIKRDIELFRDITSQYIFISSATVYEKPPKYFIVTENTSRNNPYWKYAQDKIACEQELERARAETGFTYTIVRPSYTYGYTWIPTGLSARCYNPVYRIKNRQPIIVHGDGQSLWTMTHNTDFAKGLVGLLGNSKAYNKDFHITSDEVLTWDQVHQIIGEIVGVEPNIVHIPSDFIHKTDPETGVGLLGDKACSFVFDNSKIKSVVPGFEATILFKEGIRTSIEWFESAPERMQLDEAYERLTEKLLKAYGHSHP